MVRIFTITFCFLLFTSGMAQLTGDEKKKWVSKAKTYVKNPQELKELTEGKSTYEAELNTLRNDYRLLNEAVAKKDDQIGELEELVSRIRVDAAVTKAELEKLKAGLIPLQSTQQSRGAQPKTSVIEAKQPTQGKSDLTAGVIFKVQIGAFRNKDMAKYFDNNPNFGGEVGKEPTEPQRINIGIFKDYWQADQFKKYLREMGVKDAWIVPYRDGIRVEIKDVLNNIISGDQPLDQN